MCVHVTLSWMILSSTFDDEPGIDSTDRDSDQTKFPDCFPHAMVNVRGCEIPRNVLEADTIVVSCGFANFEKSSWSMHRRHEFWGTHGELRTTEDYGKFVHSFKHPEYAKTARYGRLTAESWTIPTTTGA